MKQLLRVWAETVPLPGFPWGHGVSGSSIKEESCVLVCGCMG